MDSRSASIPPTIRPYRAAASKTPPGWRLAAASLIAAFCSSSNEAVEYLLGRAEAAQRSANALNDRMKTLETETGRAVAELRQEVATRIETEIESAQADYRPVRIFGSVAFVVGLALTTWGNFA